MISILSSPRRRRRLATVAGTLFVFAVIVGVAAHFVHGSETLSSHFSKQPEQRVKPNPPTVKLTRSNRHAVEDVARAFVSSAVFRRSVDRSWPLTTPAFRQGLSRPEWDSGSIPVIPYPVHDAAAVRWSLHYSYRNRVGYWVAIIAKPQARSRSQTFSLEVRADPAGGGRHWLVSYWAPAGFSPVAAANVGRSNAIASTEGPSHQIRAVWLLAPVGLIAGTIVMLPGTLFVRGRIRRRRARMAEGIRQRNLAS